jgi:hypothetical protein
MALTEVAISKHVNCEIATSGRPEWEVTTECPEWKVAAARSASGSCLGRLSVAQSAT